MIGSFAITLTVLIFPAFQICKYHVTVPTPTTNYLAEYNKKVLATPESERAWTHYKKILEQEASTRNQKDLDQPTQGKLLLDVRKASEFEDLGFLLSDGSPDSTLLADAELLETPLFLYLEFAPAVELPQFASYLDSEAALAAGNGNWDLATDDILAMLNIAKQLNDVPLVYFLDQSYQVGRQAMERVLICLMHQSSGFSNDQLLRLEERIKNYRLEKFQSDFAGEHWIFADMLQRAFVITESGDGYIHLSTFYAWNRQRIKGWDLLSAPWVAERKMTCV